MPTVCRSVRSVQEYRYLSNRVSNEIFLQQEETKKLNSKNLSISLSTKESFGRIGNYVHIKYLQIERER